MASFRVVDAAGPLSFWDNSAVANGVVGQNGTEATLTGKHLRAAVLEAADELTDEQIADAVGVARSTFNRWRAKPEYAAEVDRQKQAILAQALRLPIAKKHKRLSVLNDLHDKQLAVIDARAIEHGPNLKIAGGATGLMVREFKMIGSGRDAQVVETYGVDVALLREIRGTQEQAAKEVGDWSDGSTITAIAAIQLVGVRPEDI